MLFVGNLPCLRSANTRVLRSLGIQNVFICYFCVRKTRGGAGTRGWLSLVTPPKSAINANSTSWGLQKPKSILIPLHVIACIVIAPASTTSYPLQSFSGILIPLVQSFIKLKNSPEDGPYTHAEIEQMKLLMSCSNAEHQVFCC